MSRQVITGLTVQVEITAYDDQNRVTGRALAPSVPGQPDRPIIFTALEAAIPPAVVEWVRQSIGMKEG